MGATARKRSACFLAWLCLGAGSPAVAQQGASELEEIIVTGSRIRQRLEDAPVAVVVLNRDDIDRRVEDSIGKVLPHSSLGRARGEPAIEKLRRQDAGEKQGD